VESDYGPGDTPSNAAQAPFDSAETISESIANPDIVSDVGNSGFQIASLDTGTVSDVSSGLFSEFADDSVDSGFDVIESFGEVDIEDSFFDSFLDWFADGGIVRKKRKSIPRYADGGIFNAAKPVASKRRRILPPEDVLGGLSDAPAVSTAISGPATGSFAGAFGTGLASPSNTSMALAGGKAVLGLGNPVGLLAGLLVSSVMETFQQHQNEVDSEEGLANALANSIASQDTPEGVTEGTATIGLGFPGTIGADGAIGDGLGGLGSAAGDGIGDAYKSGGEVKGRGTGTSDSIIARLSDGEFVIPADVVDKLGEDFFDDLLAEFHVPVSKQRSA